MSLVRAGIRSAAGLNHTRLFVPRESSLTWKRASTYLITAAFDPQAMSLNKRIGFLGSGQMAEALARGLIDRGVVQADQICCSDPSQSRKELFRSLGATPYDSNLEVCCCCCCCCCSAQTEADALMLLFARPCVPAHPVCPVVRRVKPALARVHTCQPAGVKFGKQ